MSGRRGAVFALALAGAATVAARGDETGDGGALRLQALAPVAGGLTADEVARVAARVSPEARARAADRDAAAAQVDQALALAFPRLGLTARYTRLSAITLPSLGTLVAAGPGTPSGPLPKDTQLYAAQVSFPVILDNYLLQASLQVPISDYALRIVQGLAAAKQSREAAELTARASRLKAASDARLLFYNWVRARGGALVGEEALDTARGHLADLQHMLDAGVVSRADVLRVDSQVAAAELAVERAKNLVEVLEGQLRVTLADPRRELRLGEDLLVELPPLPLPATSDAIYDEALSQRLEVRALEQAIGSADKQRSLAFAGYLPRLDAFGDALYANPNPRIFPSVEEYRFTWDAGVQLTWSPNDAGAAVGARRAAAAGIARLEAQRQQLLDGLRVELTQSRGALREADLGVAVSLRGLRAAEESYRVRRELFRQGKATSIELTDAENDLTRARLEALSARIDQRGARTRMLHALGRDAADAK